MSFFEPMKSTYPWAAIIMLGVAASTAVFADQDIDDELSAIEPPLSCLGLQPCDVTRELPVLSDRVIRKKGSAEAERVLQQVYATPEADKKFLYDKLSTARGFAIFPEVQKSGVMAASVYGKGIISFRDQSWEWNPPILLTMQGKSFGPQMVAQSSRIIFVFDKICDIRDFLSGYHHLVTTGSSTVMKHVGHPEPTSPGGINVYVVRNGMSMGQSLESYSIQIDEEANAALYGIDFNPGCIVEGRRIGLQLPWFMQFMQNMQLPPGQPHSTTTIK
jgi:lipid-binding SYLF domain-containing protein